MRLELDRDRIDEVVTAVADRLAGNYLLIGGAAVALWLEPRRVTEDIDIIGFEGDSRQRLALMDLAAEMGLPIEAVNSAADFFVFRIADWRDHVVPLRTGRTCTVYRPTPTLFLLLKIGRLGETDLADCLSAIRQHGAELDRERILRALIEGDDLERNARVQTLRAMLSR